MGAPFPRALSPRPLDDRRRQRVRGILPSIFTLAPGRGSARRRRARDRGSAHEKSAA
jgi:hypothetical protein